MTLGELRQRWEHRREEWSRLGVSVEGARLASEIVADLDRLAAGADEQLLSLAEAAAASGYHPESLARLIRQGRLTNQGTARRPRIRRADLPHKPRPSLAKPSGRSASSRLTGGAASALRDASSIVRDAIAGRIRGVAP